MPKTTTFTTITPLPTGITRKSVLEMYQDHMAMIDLNPLVVERFKCKAPSYAPPEEYFAAWYTIKDKVSYLPGGLAQGSVSYHACFHDTPEGLQTHVYAPLGLDIRGKWTIGGSLPGEPTPLALSGLNTPRHGLFIREDVTMTCSALLMRFVKRTFKDSHASLVQKLVEKAHLLESSFANERLRALLKVAPGERNATGNIFIAPPPDYLSPPRANWRAGGYMSPPPRAQSPPEPSLCAPTPGGLKRTNTEPMLSPYYPSSPQSHRSRSNSDPIASPGFSSTSTLVSESDQPATPPKDYPPKVTINRQPAESGPYLLPATRYAGGLSQNPVTPPPASDYESNYSPVTLQPPRISYSPQERAISFTFTYDSPFDTLSRSASRLSSNHNLLDEIDDAIDQVFLYSLSSHSYSDDENPSKHVLANKMPASTPDTLTAREAGVGPLDTLPATKYNANAKSATKTLLPKSKSYEDDLAKTTRLLPPTKYQPPTSTSTLATLPATRYEDDLAKTSTLPATKYEPAKAPPHTLPATRYEPAPLASINYKPQRPRKDSAVPLPWLEKELPPVPLHG
ncbi:hypothetical protein ACEQ8H_003324 [Pleosporales sp. CAS-2024a]